MLRFCTLFAIHAALLVISACATTDILRLTSLACTSIHDPNCYCPVCGTKLRLRDQIPLLSFIISKGKCHYCGSRIPLTDSLFELLLFCVFSAAAVSSRYGLTGFLFIVAAYELIKVLMIVHCGRRADRFAGSCLHSLLSNLLHFALLGVLFLAANALPS